MAGKVQRLSKHQIETNRKYFLDSNVWVFALSNILSPTPKELIYIDFIGRLLEDNQAIYSHTLVIAEVFNAIARINFKNYKRNVSLDPKNQLNRKEIDDLDFKRSYRGSEDYMYHLDQFKTEFEVYSKNIKIVDKELDLDIAYP